MPDSPQYGARELVSSSRLEYELSRLRGPRLRFSEPLEAEYRCYQNTNSTRYLRPIMLVGLFLTANFGIMDLWLNPSVHQSLWALRFGFICPLILILYLMGGRRRCLPRIHLYVAVICGLIGAAFVVMAFIGSSFSAYLFNAGAVIIVVYLYMQGPFISASVAAWSITVLYEIGLIYTRHPLAGAISDTSLLVTCNVIGMMACYSTERETRRGYLQARLLEQREQEMERQKEVSESLLLNILPAPIAAELTEKGAVDPRYYEDVTILFTDFQRFTLSAETMSSEELVGLLNQYFSAFDVVTQSYGLEKLKTIGDSYMAVAGLPVRRSSHAVDAVLAAFDIVDYVTTRKHADPRGWAIRVGVHTGPVVSGVVGVRKFAFDVWGESVNFASRMESSGFANRVNLSEATRQRIKDFFLCEHRGKVHTKEGRAFDMYFAVGILPELAVNVGLCPPPAFAARYYQYFGQPLNAFPKGLLA